MPGPKAYAYSYTCVGDVRGPCGVRHRSVRTAAACSARDHAGCEQQGGYSDRRLHLATGGFATVDEQREYDAYIDGDIS